MKKVWLVEENWDRVRGEDLCCFEDGQLVIVGRDPTGSYLSAFNPMEVVDNLACWDRVEVIR